MDFVSRRLRDTAKKTGNRAPCPHGACRACTVVRANCPPVWGCVQISYLAAAALRDSDGVPVKKIKNWKNGETWKMKKWSK